MPSSFDVLATGALVRETRATNATHGNKLGYCPAHADRVKTFEFRVENDKVMLKCWHGCTLSDLIDAIRGKVILPDYHLHKCVNLPDKKIGLYFHDQSVGSFTASFDDPDVALRSVFLYHDEDGRLGGFRALFSNTQSKYYSHVAMNKNVAMKNPGCPYRLHYMLTALADECPIMVFQTEKECEEALTLGLEECTSFGGPADPLPHSYWTKFSGAKVVVWAHDNKPGMKRAEEIALFLHRNKCDVKIAVSPSGNNFSDWIESGVHIQEIAALLKKTNLWLPAAQVMSNMAEQGTMPHTAYTMGSESMAGEYYAHKFRNEVRFAPEFKSWMNFNSKVWQLDKAGVHAEKAKQVAVLLRQDLQQCDPGNAKALDKLATKAESDAGRKAIISTAKTVESLLIDSEKLDNLGTKHLLSCDSGMINLRTGDITEHSPEYLITKHVPLRIDMDNTPVRFLQLIGSFWDDHSVCEWMLNHLGYCLTGENGFQHFPIWVGLPGTGKSQLQIIMRGITGPHCGDLDAGSLVEAKQRSAAVESDLAGIRGCRLVFGSELSEKHMIDEKIIKAITGQDVIRVKFMGQDKFSLRANAKLIFTANDRPMFSGSDAIARRLIEVQFNKKPTEIIEDLGEKILAAEGPQILGYLVKRARKTYEKPECLSIPNRLRGWTDEYIDQMDYLKQWWDISAMPMRGAFSKFSDVAVSVEEYCRENRIPTEFTYQQLHRRMQKFGCIAAVQNGKTGWLNVELRFR